MLLRPGFLVRGIWVAPLFCILLFGFILNLVASAQSESGAYARKHAFGIFAAYSEDSSHILLGAAEQRELFDIGLTYNRRLILNNVMNWQYSGEVLPVALESDPLTRFVNNETSPTTSTYSGTLNSSPVTCGPVTYSYSTTVNGVTYSGTETYSCYGRQWTIGEAMSPIGMQWNFQPRRKMQPFVDGHGGYMYSTRPIPIAGAGSFNFTFDVGAGIELYRSKAQSVRFEYRYHHISNHGTANVNPGIDNGIFQLTYAIGR